MGNYQNNRNARRGGRGQTCVIETVERRMMMSGTPVPAGPEFQVNEQAAGAQFTSLAQSVATDAQGNFVVVWTTQPGGTSRTEVRARRFDATGAPRGPEFRVSTASVAALSPSVAMNASGEFLVVWEYSFPTTRYGDLDVYAQRFGPGGDKVGGEFRVNTTTANGQSHPYAGMADNGTSVVAWTSECQDPKSGKVAASDGIYAQRFGPLGAKLGAEFRVNDYLPDAQRVPSVAMDRAGNFLVAWQSYGQDGSDWGVYAKRYSASGAALAGEVRVNVATAGRQVNPTTAPLPGGGFAVAWEHNLLDGTLGDVHLRRYDGATWSDVQVANTFTAGSQWAPSVAADDLGNTTVVWHGQGQDGSDLGVFGQRYDPAGAPSGSEFRLNDHTETRQAWASVAAQPDGRFVAAWSSMGQDGDNDGVFARLFAPPTTTESTFGDTTIAAISSYDAVETIGSVVLS